jgi:4-hydroxy-3-methylbut-2-en-1-yl diphosphate synthase IspG/GcpE
MSALQGRVAQSVEQRIENPRVGGSSPSPATIFHYFNLRITMDTKQVNQCVDALCQCGCDAVRATIVAMEAGADIPQLHTLDSEGRAVVLNELKAVMSVYDARK